MLSGIGKVTGLDVDPDVKNNRWLSNASRLYRWTNAVCRPIV